jgi:hypothetical protein
MIQNTMQTIIPKKWGRNGSPLLRPNGLQPGKFKRQLLCCSGLLLSMFGPSFLLSRSDALPGRGT